VACAVVGGRILVGLSCSPDWVVKVTSGLQQSPSFDAVDVGGVGGSFRVVIVVVTGQ